MNSPMGTTGISGAKIKRVLKLLPLKNDLADEGELPLR